MRPHMDSMKTPSEQTAAQVRAEIEAKDIQVRKNMERLRELRLAKEAEEAALGPKTAPKSKSKSGGKTTASKSKSAAPQKLSEWLAAERAGGHKT